jgi:hypothetical protein
MLTERPNEFKFEAIMYRDEDSLMYPDPSGDNAGQSPIWIRPMSLMRSNKQNPWIKDDYVQIVGHTRVRMIDIAGKATGGKYFLIDTLEQGEYLIGTDNWFSVGTL